MPNQTATLAFLGDIMLGRGISSLVPTCRPAEFWGDTLPVLRSADAVVANLECPITTHGSQWRRTWKAFRFRAVPQAVDILKVANVRCVNLANNHVLDYEDCGLRDTLQYLDAAGIAHVGAGRNSREAARPAICEVAGHRIGFLGLTDNVPEFSAGLRSPGTNFMRIRSDHVTLTLLDLLVQDVRRAGADIVVLSVHWGPNLRPWPPARFRNFARAVLDLGVDVVHGHSAHLFQGVETAGNGLILYDAGDILDDYWVFPGIRTDHSFILLVEIAGGRLRRLRMVPVALDRTSVRLANRAESSAIRQRMGRRCQALGTAVVEGSDSLEIRLPASGRSADAAPDPALGRGRLERHWPSFFAW
jgi:poly-gamma-glutamate synthesis protein (capsule biosynthesis protein)